MSERRLNPGWHFLLIAVGVATIALGWLWPKKALVPRPPSSASAVASAVPSAVRRSRLHVVPRPRGALSPMTYCPGPVCTVEKKARRDCELRHGVFSAEPDFVCKLDDGVHRMVCDDIDDEHQCGMMSHSDYDYARAELQRYFEKRKDLDVDLLADFNEGKLHCIEGEREIECSFTKRATGAEHPDSPIVCNWMGCGFPFGASAD